MAQTAGPDDQLPDEIGKLASDTTELGIVVGDMFRYACAGLFGREPETARFVAESRAWVTRSTLTLDRRVRAIIERYRPMGDDLRRIVELQQACADYARIANHSTRIADLAVRLGGASEELLTRVSADTPTILYTLISLVYDQMRGVFLVTAARDLGQARALVASHADIESYYARLSGRLTRATGSNRFAAPGLQLLVMVASNMRQIAAAVVAICDAALFTPPPNAL